VVRRKTQRISVWTTFGAFARDPVLSAAKNRVSTANSRTNTEVQLAGSALAAIDRLTQAASATLVRIPRGSQLALN
jgi:hypothetical protein